MQGLEKEFKRAQKVFIPKGENRTRVTELMEANGVIVPAFPGRCLHGRS
jgi:hypothetical protein